MHKNYIVLEAAPTANPNVTDIKVSIMRHAVTDTTTNSAPLDQLTDFIDFAIKQWMAGNTHANLFAAHTHTNTQH